MEDAKHIAMKRIKLLIVIVDRGIGEQVAELLRHSGVTFNMISKGYGAAGSDIISYLGLTDSHKDVVLSVITEDKVFSVLNRILYKFNLNTPGNGIAFTIPITGVSGPLALRYMSGIPDSTSKF